MMNANRNAGGMGAGKANGVEELDAIWQEFEQKLAGYLVTMTDPDEGDHLRIEFPDPDPGDGAGCPPYAQFAGFGDGAMLRAELSGNAYLHPQHQLVEAHCEVLSLMGWDGNHADGDNMNWFMERRVAQAEEVAERVVHALRGCFGIVHPHLLTYVAWGPAAAGSEVLGLCASDEVPLDSSSNEPLELAVMAEDRDELVARVGDVLRPKYGNDLFVDDDGDFVIRHMNQPVWIRVLEGQPAVEIVTRIAHDVRSRRATAVELGLLNRDTQWAKWTLRERAVWLSILLPGLPFVPLHLEVMIDVFLEVMTHTRDDLAYRTGAKVA